MLHGAPNTPPEAGGRLVGSLGHGSGSGGAGFSRSPDGGLHHDPHEKVYDVPTSYCGPQWETQHCDTGPGGGADPDLAGASPRAAASRRFRVREEEPRGSTKLDRGGDLCVVMVGLPGRGKTYLAHKLCRYINWLGINSRCFLVSEYLRQPRFMGDGGPQKFRASYFDPCGPEAAAHAAERLAALSESLADIREFLTGDGQVALLDGQASSLHIRSQIHDSLSTLVSDRRIIYVEVVMDDAMAQELYELKVRNSMRAAILDQRRDSDHNPRSGGGDGATGTSPGLYSPTTRAFLQSRPAAAAGAAPGTLPPAELAQAGSVPDFPEGSPPPVPADLLLGPECGEYEGMTLEQALDDFKRRVGIFKRDYVSLNAFPSHSPASARLQPGQLRCLARRGTAPVLAVRARTEPTPTTGEGDEVDSAARSAHVRIVDEGGGRRTRYETTGLHGFLPSRMVQWLFNLSPSHRLRHPIYFARHGQSEYNLENRIGGDPGLTPRGEEDAALITNWVSRAGYSPDELEVWTSRMRRTVNTGRGLQQLGYKTLRWRALNEIHAGVCEGLTYKEVKERFPYIEEFRKEDKYAFRYPEGESYQDLVNRLEPVLMELECAENPVLIISHQAVLRCIFAYFEETAAESATNVSVPQATVWEYHPTGQGVGTMIMHALREDSATDAVALSDMTFGPMTVT